MDNELIAEILTDFKMINGITTGDNDNLFTLYIKKAMQTILNITNRYQFPKELKYIVLEMVNEFYLGNTFMKDMTGDKTSESIKSISEAGRSVTFGQASEAAINSFLSTYINNQLDSRKRELNKFTLLYKLKPKE